MKHLKSTEDISNFIFIVIIISHLFLWQSFGYSKTLSPVVNIQIDGEYLEGDRLTPIMQELINRDFKATIYITSLFANENRLILDKFINLGYEVAAHGYRTGEMLDTLFYNEQKRIIESSIRAVSSCISCGYFSPPAGFRPQFFSQNEDTFNILDSFGIIYNSGFIEGMKYMLGHERDAFPYLVNGHIFYAVPISSVINSKYPKGVYLCDMSVKLNYKLTADEWLEILKWRLKLSIDKNIPMVIIIHDMITGMDPEYFSVFVKFLDILKEEGLKTVTTIELVNMCKEESL